MNDKKHSCLYASFLFWLLISICASALLIWCARKAYGSINPKRILFLETLVVLSLALHLKHETDRQTMSGKLPSAGKQTGSTARPFSPADTLGFTNSNPSYDIRYDYIRLFAVFCVILLHCLGIAMPELSMEITDETRALLQEIPPLFLKPAAVLHTCLYLGNTCFLMLTGALLFGRGTKGGIASFYERRFSKVVLTSVIYFFFYMWQNGRLNPVCADTLREAFHRILSGSIQEDCPFLWLVYMTLSIYVAVPFLQYMFEAMPYRALTSLSAVLLVCMFLKTYTLMTTDLLPFFAQWIGIAMIGYWVSRPRDPEIRPVDLDPRSPLLPEGSAVRKPLCILAELCQLLCAHGTTFHLHGLRHLRPGSAQKTGKDSTAAARSSPCSANTASPSCSCTGGCSTTSPSTP